MLKCPFCDIDKTKIENTILDETQNFYVMPTLGSIVEGYVLIVSKRHINSMSELTVEEMNEYEYLINKYREIFKKIYKKYPIVFEHGSPNIENKTKANSVSHAHTHIVNHHYKNEKDLIKELNFKAINSINVKINRNYIFYINQSNCKYITYDFKPISQLMRIKIANDLNIPNEYSWYNNKFENNIILTINKLESYLNNHDIQDRNNDIVNCNQCLNVIEGLNNYFKNKNGLANIEYPSNIIYKTNEYYLYMFYSCLLDYGMRSKIYHKNLSKTYEVYPDIFVPRKVLKMNENTLKDIIVNYIHPRYPNVAFKKWISLSQKLVEYDSILNCLKNINSFEELEFFVKNIKGYGQKTGGLLIRIISDSKICNFKEDIESIPIDRHDIEISYLTGIINDEKISEKNIKILSDTFVKIGKELGINPSDIDKYLWEVGNSFCNKKECKTCPLRCYCSKGSEKNE